MRRARALVFALLFLAACRADRLGGVAGELELAPLELDFGEVTVGASKSAPVRLGNRSPANRSLRASAEGPFEVSRHPAAVPGGAELSIEVTFRPGREGLALGTLRLEVDERVLTVPLSGTGAAAPACSPASSCQRAELSGGQCVVSAVNEGQPCSTPCVGAGLCVAGACLGAFNACDDGDACTTNACAATEGCVHAPVVCPKPADPCRQAACAAGLGCQSAEAPDGTPCGANDCVTAHVCITGQCVERTAPAGSCGTLSLVAGALGGPGLADGVGTEARLPWGLLAGGAGDALGWANADVAGAGDLASGQVRSSPLQADPDAGSPRFAQLVAGGDGGSVIATVLDGNVLLRVELATGAISTIAGSPGQSTAAWDGVGLDAGLRQALALVAIGPDEALVSDVTLLRRVRYSTGQVTTVAGRAGLFSEFDGVGLDAGVRAPDLMTFDGVDTVTLLTPGAKVRQLALSTAKVTTLGVAHERRLDGGVGNGPWQWQGSAVASAPGELVFFPQQRGIAQRLDLATLELTTLAGAEGEPWYEDPVDGVGAQARLGWARGAAVDRQGLVAFLDDQCVRQLTPATGRITTRLGQCRQSGATDGPTAASRFRLPQGMTFDDQGALLVADEDNETLRRVDLAAGRVVTVAGQAREPGFTDGPALRAKMSWPHHLLAGPGGQIYFTDRWSYSVRRFDPINAVVDTVAGTGSHGHVDGVGRGASFYCVRQLALTSPTQLYLIEACNHILRRIDLTTRAVTTIAGAAEATGSADGPGPSARFRDPNGLAFDGAHRLYLADSGNHTVREYDLATGKVRTVAGAAGKSGLVNGPAAQARFNYPLGLSYQNGQLFIADSGNHAVRRLELASGQVSTVVGTAGRQGVRTGLLPGSLNNPRHVLARGRQLFITDEDAVLVAEFP